MTVAAAVLLTLAGCSAADDGDDGDDPEDTATTQESESPPVAEESADDMDNDADDADDADDDTDVVGLASTSLGEVLVDAEGMTLYMFDPDQQGASTCYDDCATAWPPLVAEGELDADDGLEDSVLGSVERTDGTQQVTYDGWPLYYFAQDAAAGDVNGQGVNDVWWVLDPTGTPIRD